MATQIQSYAMTCSVCGAPLRVTPDVGRFVCANCGSELLVERSGGAISLKPVTEAILKVQAGTDKTAAELAMKRLNNELNALEYQKRQIQAVYDQSMMNVSGGGIAIPILVVIVALCFGGVISSVFATGVYMPLCFAIGLAVGIAISLITRKSRSNKLALMSTALSRDLQPIDLAIRQTRQKIAKNRAIADS